MTETLETPVLRGKGEGVSLLLITHESIEYDDDDDDESDDTGDEDDDAMNRALFETRCPNVW